MRELSSPIPNFPPPTPCLQSVWMDFHTLMRTCKWQRQSLEKHMHIPACLLKWLGFLTHAHILVPWDHNSKSLLENEISEAELNWLHCFIWGLRHLRAQPESPKPPSRHTTDHRHMREPSRAHLTSVPAHNQPKNSWGKTSSYCLNALCFGVVCYQTHVSMKKKLLLEGAKRFTVSL